MSVGVRRRMADLHAAELPRLRGPVLHDVVVAHAAPRVPEHVCAVLLAIPVALAMARTESRLARRLLLAGVLLPLLVNLLLQGYGWLVMLGPAGLLNRALLAGGVIGRPLRCCHEHGVLLA